MWGYTAILPVVGALVWLTMLLALLLTWVVDGTPRLASMNDGQTIAYISDTGAFRLKPLFISMSSIMVACLNASFLVERYLRHNGLLVANTSKGQKALSIGSIAFSTLGGAGIILLSIFDTYHHNTLHNIFLLFFIGGYWISAIFICAEYQRLGIKYREHRILRISFWTKLAFVLGEFFLVIAFASTSWTGYRNTAAVLEWIVALVFTFYVLSFVIDLWPAVRTKDRRQRFIKPSEMEEGSPTPMQRDAEPAASRY